MSKVAQLLEPEEHGGKSTGGKELSVASSMAAEEAAAKFDRQMAKMMPRNENACFQSLMVACTRLGFAEAARYEFPRGKKPDGSTNYVSGPSINLAREAGRLWENLDWGLLIMRADEESVLLRGFAFDKQTGVRVIHEDLVSKLIQRKDKDSKETKWVTPDERDLRELINRRGALAVRNCLLQLMPKDLIDDAMERCMDTIEKNAGKDPDAIRKRLLFDFGAMNVTVEMLEQKIGHPFNQCTPKEYAELRAVCTSIQEGNTTWAEYTKPAEETAPAKDPDKVALAAAQESLKRQQEQPKPDDPPKPAEAPAQSRPAEQSDKSGGSVEKYTYGQAKGLLQETENIALMADIMNWSVTSKVLTQEQVKELRDLKDSAKAKAEETLKQAAKGKRR